MSVYESYFYDSDFEEGVADLSEDAGGNQEDSRLPPLSRPSFRRSEPGSAAETEENNKESTTKQSMRVHEDTPNMLDVLLDCLSPPLPPELCLAMVDFLPNICGHCQLAHNGCEAKCSVCSLEMANCKLGPRCRACSHRTCQMCHEATVCDACWPTDEKYQLDECYTCGRQYCNKCVSDFGELRCGYCAVEYLMEF